MEQNNTDNDWRKDITPSLDQIKLKDGGIVKLEFKDEGKKKVHPDFGESIVFTVRLDGEDKDKVFYVKSNNFSLLKQVKELGSPLTGIKAEISRIGALKSNTRYTVKKI